MNHNIAAFGEVMMRLEVSGHHLLTQSNQLHYLFTGTGLNVTGALARYGYDSYLVSTLPDNVIGDAALAHIRGLGINSGFLQRQGDYMGMYFLENGFGSRPSRVTYTHRDSSSFNTAEPDIYDMDTLAQTMDVLHLCGITLAMNATVRQQMKDLAKAVKKHGGRVVFDCNFRPSLWGENGYAEAKRHYEEMLHLADIVLMGEKDAVQLLNEPTPTVTREEQVRCFIPQVADRFDISVIAGKHRDVLTDGSHTLTGFIYKQGSFYYSEAYTFAVLDRIGSGDAFASSLIHGELSGMSAVETVDFSTAASALSHTVSGDTPMSTIEEIQNYMYAFNQDIER